VRGVRVVSVGYSDMTAALPGDALVRVFPDATIWHRSGDLHRITVENGAVVESVVPHSTREYLVGMAAFAGDGE
jgi:hypothetical protein